MPQTPMPQVHPIPPLFDAESRVLILEIGRAHV